MQPGHPSLNSNYNNSNSRHASKRTPLRDGFSSSQLESSHLHQQGGGSFLPSKFKAVEKNKTSPAGPSSSRHLQPAGMSQSAMAQRMSRSGSRSPSHIGPSSAPWASPVVNHQHSTSQKKRSESPSHRIRSTKASTQAPSTHRQFARSPSPSRKTTSAKISAQPPLPISYRTKEPSINKSHTRRHSTNSASFESLSSKNSREEFYTPRSSLQSSKPVAGCTPDPPSYPLHQRMSNHSTIPSHQSSPATKTYKPYITSPNAYTSTPTTSNSRGFSRGNCDDSFSSAITSHSPTQPPCYRYPTDSVAACISPNIWQKAGKHTSDSYLNQRGQDEYTSMRHSGSLIGSTPRERRRQEKIVADVTETGKKRHDSLELPQVANTTNPKRSARSKDRSSSVAECLNSSSAETKDDLIWTAHGELSPKSKLHNLLKLSRKIKSSYTHIRSTQLSLDALEAAYLSSGVVGLANIGNTCYMNSTIQCLSHTLELTDIFLSCDIRTRASVCTEYRKAMQKIWLQHPKSQVITAPIESILKGHNVINLFDLKASVGKLFSQFSTFQQNDAQEFLRHMISGLHNEMKPADQAIPKAISTTGLSDREQGKVKWESYQSIDGSPIASIFMGQFKSSLQCTVCDLISLTFEPFWDMGLPIGRPKYGEKHVDLHRCLSLFTQNETMDGDNKPWCQKCRKNQRSIKTMTVSRFPPVLTLYMKRFSSGVTYRCKLSTPVSIPKFIDLTSYTSPETVEDFGGGKICYELYGVVNHVGTLHSGHYTADVKHFTSQLWFNYSDSRAKEWVCIPPDLNGYHTPHVGVPGQICPPFRKAHLCVSKLSPLRREASSITSAEAYLLFYRRVIK